MSSIRLEAENYKSGKQGVDYSIKTPHNVGVYRKDAVDIAATPNASNGYLLGWVEAGDWTTYDLKVPESGSYDIVAHLASDLKTSMGLEVSIDGKQQAKLQFGGSGGWTNWQDVQSDKLNLTAGDHTLRVDVLAGGFNLDYLDLVPVANTPPSPPPKYDLGNVIKSLNGSNTYTGKDGINTISYTQANSGITANLNTGVVTHKFATSSDKPLKILPLGDSITYSLSKTGTSDSYRSDLANLFKGNGYNVDFVGPQSAGAKGSDKNYTGLGSTINSVATSVNGWLSTYQPDMVLLMIGTNDLTTENNIKDAPNRLSNLIDKITTSAPNTQVLVASIPPISTTNKEKRFGLTKQVVDFDSKIPQIVKSKADQGKKVSFVDVYSSLKQSDLVQIDGIQPNKQGNSKIAKTWYDAILKTNSATDKLEKIDNIIGSPFDDTLIGNARNNILNGGGGNDTLTGGGGQDIFVVSSGSGTATITDFIPGQDYLGLSNGLKFDQLSVTQGTGTHANDTLISYTGKQIAVLNSVQASSIKSSSFITV